MFCPTSWIVLLRRQCQHRYQPKRGDERKFNCPRGQFVVLLYIKRNTEKSKPKEKFFLWETMSTWYLCCRHPFPLSSPDHFLLVQQKQTPGIDECSYITFILFFCSTLPSSPLGCSAPSFVLTPKEFHNISASILNNIIC